MKKESPNGIQSGKEHNPSLLLLPMVEIDSYHLTLSFTYTPPPDFIKYLHIQDSCVWCLFYNINNVKDEGDSRS